jgi:hypothetical protein
MGKNNNAKATTSTTPASKPKGKKETEQSKLQKLVASNPHF